MTDKVELHGLVPLMAYPLLSKIGSAHPTLSLCAKRCLELGAGKSNAGICKTSQRAVIPGCLSSWAHDTLAVSAANEAWLLEGQIQWVGLPRMEASPRPMDPRRPRASAGKRCVAGKVGL